MECKCGVPAKTCVVKKAGPNQGRPFYGCADRKCDLFKWASKEPQIQTVDREAEEIESEVIGTPAPPQKKIKITINEIDLWVPEEKLMKALFFQ